MFTASGRENALGCCCISTVGIRYLGLFRGNREDRFMPFSSGGGSHGGGFHGGIGFHGGTGHTLNSRTLVKTQWFAGSRLYLKRNADGYYEYVYANMMPRKAGLAPVVVLTILFSFLFPMLGRTAYELAPHKLDAVYSGVPAVNDDIDVIDNDEALNKALSEYQQETGICPVIYTVYKEDYTGSLKDYTYNKYVGTFADEQHFVIVYAVSKEDAALLKDKKITVPNYEWEAVQGDETAVIISGKVFKGFGNIVQTELEEGSDPGIAFSEAFRYAQGQTDSAIATGAITTFAPMVLAALFFIGMLVIFVVRYWKDKDVYYVEAPAGSDPRKMSGGYSGDVTFKTQTAVPKVKIGKSQVAVPLIGLIITIVMILAGIASMVLGAALIAVPETDTGLGIFFVVLAAFWIIMGTIGMVAFISSLNKLKEAKTRMKASAPETKEVKQKSNTKAADEDEDYKRMKKRGFE